MKVAEDRLPQELRTRRTILALELSGPPLCIQSGVGGVVCDLAASPWPVNAWDPGTSPEHVVSEPHCTLGPDSSET